MYTYLEVRNMNDAWLQGHRKEDIVFGIKEPQPLERAAIRVVPLDRRQMELFFPSLEVGNPTIELSLSNIQ